jgi:hypothetical protein
MGVWSMSLAVSARVLLHRSQATIEVQMSTEVITHGGDDGTATERDDGAHAGEVAPGADGTRTGGTAAAAAGDDAALADGRVATATPIELDATVWAEALEMCAAGECRLHAADQDANASNPQGSPYLESNAWP